MKRLGLKAVLALAAVMAWSAMAQTQTQTQGQGQAGRGDGNRPEGQRRDPAAQMERLKTELKLDEKQAEKVKAVLADQNKKSRELREDTSIAQEDRRTKMQAIRAETSKKLKEILTAEQFKQYETMQAQRGPRQGEGRRSPGGGRSEAGQK